MRVWPRSMRVRHLGVEVLSDEDQLVVLVLIWLPRLHEVSVEDHVHRLVDEALPRVTVRTEGRQQSPLAAGPQQQQAQQTAAAEGSASKRGATCSECSMARTPFMRKMSAPFSCSSVLTHLPVALSGRQGGRPVAVGERQQANGPLRAGRGRQGRLARGGADGGRRLGRRVFGPLCPTPARSRGRARPGGRCSRCSPRRRACARRRC